MNPTNASQTHRMPTPFMNLDPFLANVIGLDRLGRRMSTLRGDESYPPYDIIKVNDDEYRLQMAVAGFSKDDLEITAENEDLVVRGKNMEDSDKDVNYLHRGIAKRAFERRFTLAEHVKVIGAEIQNGLLLIDLERKVPEEAKPKTIKIDAKK